MNPTLNASVKPRIIKPTSTSEVVMYENLKSIQKEVARLNDEALRNAVKFERIKAGLFTLLEQTENRFDIDGKFFCVEDALEYVDIATFCQHAFNRHQGRIAHVNEWIKEQTI
jgi:hypothetical protein